MRLASWQEIDSDHSTSGKQKIVCETEYEFSGGELNNVLNLYLRQRWLRDNRGLLPYLRAVYSPEVCFHDATSKLDPGKMEDEKTL